MIPAKLSEIAKVLGVEANFDQDVEITGVSTDTRTVLKNEIFVALKGEKFDAHDFLSSLEGKCAVAVVEREEQGVSFPLLKVNSSLASLGILGKYNLARANVKKTVALTGSVGKTTTKEFLSLVLAQKYDTCKTQGNLNNHIGVPKTLMSVDKYHEALVVEMGMSNKGEISYLSSFVKSDIAIITNIGHSHIENLKSRENIAKAKLEILESLKDDGVLVVNGDEELLKNINTRQRVIRVGFSQGCEVFAENIKASSDSVEFDAVVFGNRVHARLSCAGKHNVHNALFALCVASLCDIELESAAASFEKYAPCGMRQNVYEKDGVLVIADCYNAGVESMCASLQTLCDIKKDRESVAVLGDMLELGAFCEALHREVGKRAAELGLSCLVTYGDSARFIAEEAAKGGVERVYFFENKDDAVKVLEDIKKNSPAILFKASRSMRCEEIIEKLNLLKD